MAGAGHKLWSAGDVVAASGSTDINTALLQQIVGVYAASANRDAAFGGAGEPALSEGMVCYLNDTNEFQVYTGSAWVTIGDPAVLVVDSANARVGINTDSPSGTLDVEDATNAYIYLNDSGGTVGAHTNSQLVFQADGAKAGVVGFVGTTSGLMRLENADGPIYIETESADKIYIRPNGSTAMVIDSSGHIHVNTTNFPGTDGMLNVMGSGTLRGIQMYQDTTSTTSANYTGYSDVGGTQTKIAQIESNGDFLSATNSYGSTSDERLKTVEACRGYLNDLLALDVVNFQFTKRFVPTQVPKLDDDGNPVLDEDGEAVTEDHPTAGEFVDRDPADYSPKQLGLVAQQVEQHIPGLIKNDDYGVKSLKYSILVPMLLQAVQTLSARIEALEA